MGLLVMQLRVAKTNTQAIQFYQRQGWYLPNQSDAQDRDYLMEKEIR